MKLPENLWKSPVLQEYFQQEACLETNSNAYWFNVPQADTKQGSIELKNYKSLISGIIDPHDLQINFAYDIRKKLQKEESNGGIWIVGWTSPSRNPMDNTWNRLVMIWLDEDGDPQFAVEDDYHSFVEMVRKGVLHYVSKGVEACGAWEREYGLNALKRDLNIKEDQTNKKALLTLH